MSSKPPSPPARRAGAGSPPRRKGAPPPGAGATPVPRAGRPRKNAPVASAPRRAPGRPARTPDGNAGVREALLDAAIARFTARGIAATSLREIAGQAHVTPALLHYYYGDKAQLVDALVEERMLPAFHLVRARVAAAGDDVADTVAAFVCGLTQVMETHPWARPTESAEIGRASCRERV